MSTDSASVGVGAGDAGAWPVRTVFMQDLQDMASSQWAAHGDSAMELVALGFGVDPGVVGHATVGWVDEPMPGVVGVGGVRMRRTVGMEGSMRAGLWVLVPNVAPEVGQFSIDGEDVALVLRAMRQADADRQLGLTGDVYLWHSHYRTVEPSEEDLAWYPHWLVKQAAVYHAPSGLTTIYNDGGIIQDKTTISTLNTSQEA